MRRVKVQPKCANPLFIKWLEEWKVEAASKGSEMQYCFAKALKTIKKCPLRLETGKDCIILQNFGQKLCQMLDRKLADHKASSFDFPNVFNNEVDVLMDIQNDNKNNANCPGNEILENKIIKKRTQNSDGKELPKKKTKIPEAKDNTIEKGGANRKGVLERKNKTYFPAWRSGGYAILLTLYKKTLDPVYIGYMSKVDLQTDAQKYCDKSLKKADPGIRYSAWSSMSTLIEKGLVIKSNSPAQYRLTDAGYAMGLRISEVDANDPVFKHLSQRGTEYCSSSDSELCNQEKNELICQQSSDLKSSSHKIVDKSLPKIIENRNKVPYNEIDICKNKDDCSAGQNAELNNFQKIYDKSKNQESTESSSNNCKVVIKPHTFDVILIVDDRETAGGKVRSKDDITITELSRTNIKFEVRNLKIGDFVWIAKSRHTGEELLLPYIVERKRMDDFGSSIKDGRYYEQKFRLKKSGISNLIYLIEHHGNNQHSGLPLTTLFQAAINTLVQDGFTIKYTQSHRNSMLYLASMTLLLSRIYQEKTLISCKKEDLTHCEIQNDVIELMLFEGFNTAAAKVKNFKTKEMFIRQLIQLKNISVEKALAIAEIYPTPAVLKSAYDEAGPSGKNLLANIQFGRMKRRLGPVLSNTLHQFYTRKDF